MNLSTVSRLQNTVFCSGTRAGLRRIALPCTPRPFATSAQATIPHITAPHLSCAQSSDHVGEIHAQLREHGLLKVSLGFADKDSTYLDRLLHSLHHHHGHQLPISHSATRGWFWDVRPSKSTVTDPSPSVNAQARSETMDEFPWHTDCSYEDPPPRFFALQVLQHDRCGGGIFSVMSVARLAALLSPGTRAALATPQFRIAVPPEFVKDPAGDGHIHGAILVDAATDSEGSSTAPGMRFREDIVTPLGGEASSAIGELGRALRSDEAREHATVHLAPDVLPAGSVVLVDNRRWLHARNHVRDPERHLRRVRWDAVPFSHQV